ncbi:MAG TPA: DNA translocase FtsK 4TM domain-containing protein, partial [Candidatus Polarisedimenticolia bacterium]|nr:DNA translocase FtsK 4TM domain-containing protein [Candidatus Polarisedimenticolia bacterium]
MWPLGRLSVRRKFQILGLCLLCIGAFLALALVSRDARDQTVELLGNTAVRNQGGVLGAILSGVLVSFLGIVGSWALPLVFVTWGWNRLRVKPSRKKRPMTPSP